MTDERAEPCCRACRPDLFPSGPRQGEHHFAVRFGDHALPIWVLLDGVYQPHCTEALAGRDGLAVVEHERVWPLGCPCGSGLQPELMRHGLVEVTNRKREE